MKAFHHGMELGSAQAEMELGELCDGHYRLDSGAEEMESIHGDPVQGKARMASALAKGAKPTPFQPVEEPVSPAHQRMIHYVESLTKLPASDPRYLFGRVALWPIPEGD
jgi:hypothetical protein